MKTGIAGRSWGRVLLTAIFGGTAVAQGFGISFGGDPSALAALRVAVTVAAGVTAWGIWHRRTWAALAAVAYGLLTATMLFALGPLLGLEATARSGLRTGAIAVLAFSIASAWYVRRDVPSSEVR